MATKKKRPRDINELAAAIVAEATEEKQPESPPDNAPDEKNPHAVALGRLGGLKGGPARSKKLTKKQRSEIARKAATKRWSKKNI